MNHSESTVIESVIDESISICKVPGLFGLLRFHGCLLVWMRAQRQTSVCFLDFLLKALKD